ncbi:aromatic ring-hydroxylating oxygenase subunit alpha [Comamonas testosteroni]|uniref:aromatic ring-hydroxylating oxygenase subunit alpha n=1 Tax=Comamonas testosteroni TaxID=285 RepID=UPI00389A878E
MAVTVDHEPLLSASEVQALFNPLDYALGLPGRVYSDGRYWEAERERIFKDDWFAVGYASDVPNLGDVLPVTVAGYELVLVRGSDNEVRCFHNLCRHRGTKLVLKPANVRNITCGWHCWSYSLKGELLNTPIIAGPRTREHPSFQKPDLGLVPVASRLWHDAVFVNISGSGRPFEGITGVLDDLFARYQPGQFDLEHPVRHVDTVLKINWKLYHEGGLEGYHLPFVHPALEQPDRYEVHNDHATFSSLTGTLSKYKRLGAWVDQANDLVSLNAAAAAADRHGKKIPYTIAFITPTLVFAVWPEAIVSTMLRPLSATETGVRRNLYFIGASATSDEAAAARAKYLEIWEGITAEDADYSQGVQSLSAQRDEVGVSTRFSPYWESAVHKFQQRIATKAYRAGLNCK